MLLKWVYLEAGDTIKDVRNWCSENKYIFEHDYKGKKYSLEQLSSWLPVMAGFTIDELHKKNGYLLIPEIDDQAFGIERMNVLAVKIVNKLRDKKLITNHNDVISAEHEAKAVIWGFVELGECPVCESWKEMCGFGGVAL